MDNNITPEGLLTVAEAARRLGRSQEQVRRYLREGRLTGRRLGGQWFMEEASLGSVYPAPKARGKRIAEPATMETTQMAGTGIKQAKFGTKEWDDLVKRIDANREVIRKRLGGNIDTDIVEMLRKDREEH